jgi:hypothetical protein
MIRCLEGSPEASRILRAETPKEGGERVPIVSAVDHRAAMDTPQHTASSNATIVPLPFALPVVEEEPEELAQACAEATTSSTVAMNTDVSHEAAVVAETALDGAHFRQLMNNQKEVLLGSVADWQLYLSEYPDLEEGIRGDIAAAVGKALLICNSRFKQVTAWFPRETFVFFFNAFFLNSLHFFICASSLV